MKIMDFKNQMLEKMYDGTIRDVWFHPNVKEYRQESIWFAGGIFTFTYHNLSIVIETKRANHDFKVNIIGKTEKDKIFEQYNKSFWTDEAIGEYLKHICNVYSDNEIFNKDYTREEVIKQLKKDDTKKVYINCQKDNDYFYEKSNNNYFKIAIYDKKNNYSREHLETSEAYSLTKILNLGMDGILDYVKEHAGDRLDKNYEFNQMKYVKNTYSSDEGFIKNVCFEKAKNELIEKYNLDAVQCEKEFTLEKFHSYELDIRSKDEFEKMYKNYTPEAMFKFCGISKPFDSKGYPTTIAKLYLRDINKHFFKNQPIEKTIEFIVIGKDNTYKTPEETKFIKLLSKVSGNDCDKKTYEEFEKVHEQVIEMYDIDFDDVVENKKIYVIDSTTNEIAGEFDDYKDANTFIEKNRNDRALEFFDYSWYDDDNWNDNYDYDDNSDNNE